MDSPSQRRRSQTSGLRQRMRIIQAPRFPCFVTGRPRKLTQLPHHTGLGARLGLGHAGRTGHIRALEFHPRKSWQPQGLSICDM